MAMISKYNNICPACGIRIVAGRDWIEPKKLPGYDKDKWCHVQCPTNDLPALGTTVKTFKNLTDEKYRRAQSNDRGNKFASINVPLPIEPQKVNFIESCMDAFHHQEGVDCLNCGGNHFEEDLSDAIAGAIEQSLLEPEIITEKVFTPSKYQQAIFDAITAMVNKVAEFKHLVVEAVAGSGKTTTIKQSLKLIPNEYQVFFVAFNKHIANPLAEWLQSIGIHNVKAATLHSLGLSNYKRAFPKFNSFNDIEEDKVGVILEDYYPVQKKKLFQVVNMYPVGDIELTKDIRKAHYQKRDGMRKIVSICKSCLTDTNNQNEVKEIIDRYNLDIEEKYIDELVNLLPVIMQRCKDWTEKIDYDDMIWLPIVLNLDLEKADFLMVDETQDLNKLQIEFIMRSIKEDGHIIAVGDRYQSLYAFRGADANAIPNIIQALDAKVLPLSVTYRCPSSHVKQAQALVPHLEARENAPEGTLDEVDYYNLAKVVQSGDLVICRTNGPLVKPAFECIRRGKKAVIRGKDIGSSLTNLVKRFETDDIDQFVANLGEYYEQEHSKLMNYGKEMKALLLQDRYETLLFIANECNSVSELTTKINMLFSDKETGVIFSSVHKAKGLEADHIYILRPDLMPFPKAQTDIEIQQELNCKYVAQTRSKDILTYVKGGENV